MQNAKKMNVEKSYSTKTFLIALGITLLVVSGIICGIIAIYIDPLVFTAKGTTDPQASIYGMFAWVLILVGAVLTAVRTLRPKKVVYTLEENSKK